MVSIEPVRYIRDRLDGGFAYSGAGAFQGCTSLKNIRIPISVKKIGFRSFADCSNLRIYYEDGFCGELESEGEWE